MCFGTRGLNAKAGETPGVVCAHVCTHACVRVPVREADSRTPVPHGLPRPLQRLSPIWHLSPARLPRGAGLTSPLWGSALSPSRPACARLGRPEGSPPSRRRGWGRYLILKAECPRLRDGLMLLVPRVTVVP